MHRAPDAAGEKLEPYSMCDDPAATITSAVARASNSPVRSANSGGDA